VPASTDDPSQYHLRWFTPDAELELCGHGTLAATHVIMSLSDNPGIGAIKYHTQSGTLTAKRTQDGLLELDFPADDVITLEPGTEWGTIENAVMAATKGHVAVKTIFHGKRNLAIEVAPNAGLNLADLDIDTSELVCPAIYVMRMHGTVLNRCQLQISTNAVIITAETGETSEDRPRFHSRCLYPSKTIPEDCVTGSAHCMLGIIYAPRFDAMRRPIIARQGGPRRQGQITVVWDGNMGHIGGRMKLRGNAITGEPFGMVYWVNSIRLMGLALVAKGHLFL
jgi:predicted PhzF superfamily epimerase YddE/YHI9